MTETPKIDTRDLIGMRLRAARRATGKTQAEVCRAIGVSPNKWSQWESARHMPDMMRMIEFSNTYNITLDWIYRGRSDGMASDRSERVWAIFNGLVAEISSAA